MVPCRARDPGEGPGQVVSETLRDQEDRGGYLTFKDLAQGESPLLQKVFQSYQCRVTES